MTKSQAGRIVMLSLVLWQGVARAQDEIIKDFFLFISMNIRVAYPKLPASNH